MGCSSRNSRQNSTSLMVLSSTHSGARLVFSGMARFLLFLFFHIGLQFVDAPIFQKSCATKPPVSLDSSRQEGSALRWIPPAKAAPPPLETTAKGCGSPVATSKCRRHFEAPTEPAGETAVPFGFPCQQGVFTTIGNPEVYEPAVPLQS